MDEPEEVKILKRKITELELEEMKEVQVKKEETASKTKQRTVELLESLEENPPALKKVCDPSATSAQKERADPGSVILVTVEIEPFLETSFTSLNSSRRLDYSYVFQSSRHCSNRQTSEQTRISRQSYRLTFLDSTTHSRPRSQSINRFGSRRSRGSRKLRS